MFQSFSPLELREIDFLRTMKRRFVVIQTYDRNEGPRTDNKKMSLLLTDYDALANARAHRNSIANDKRAVIFDLENDSHFKKLTEMLDSNSRYAIYKTALVNGSNSHKLGELV